MSNLQSNEKHLADKLRQAPVPDVDRSWEQMRELLDREMPEAVAGGWAGNKRWWWMGITAALIMGALWLTQQLNERDQKTVAVEQPADTQAAADTKNNEETAGNTSRQSSDKSSADNSINTTNPTNTNNSPAQNSVAAPLAASENTAVEINEARGTTSTVKKSGTSVALDQSSENKTTNQPAAAQRSFERNNKNGNKKAGAQEMLVSSRTSQVWKQQPDQAAYGTTNKTDRTKNRALAKNINTGVIGGSDAALNESSEEFGSTREAFIAGVEQSGNKFSPSDEFDNINVSASDAIAVSGKTDKAYLKQLRKKMIKEDNRRMSKAGMRGNFGDDGREITFAAGITLPQSFALGQQQSSPYSVSGKTSRFMDYLPAPFFQYHVNNKLFLQTEFHFQSPQYTNRLLLASSSTEPATNVRLEKNVYLEKLYYFNIPFNVYYTPAKNFSVGSGLQYSSLLSGVASFEEKRVEGQTTSGYQSVTRRFKDDSVAAKFAPSEWRYQFDANYYFKRFTLGLRYNQALRDFVSLPAAPGLPATQDRNKSFLLYLRFNIWEERKKE